jgi:hypothetical protein
MHPHAVPHRRRSSRSALLVVLLLLLWICLPHHQATAQAANLITNGDFERGGEGWTGCGDVDLADRQQNGVSDAMVYGGRYALRVTYNPDDNCGGDPFFEAESQANQQLTIPADAPALTVSFRYSRIGATQLPLQVILATQTGYVGRFATLDPIRPEDLSGWNLYRAELSQRDLEQARGQTLKLYFAIYVVPGVTQPTVSDTDPPGYYIDDVRVSAGIERTQAAPMPPALYSDGTRPIVLTRGGVGQVRINSDGSDAQALAYQGRIGRAITPTWSSDGGRIAVLESWLTPETNSDATVIPAFITLVTVMDANGENAREIYRTGGLPGVYRVPNDPANPNRPALDVEIGAIDWSPDNSALALSICARNRDFDGSSSDPVCFVEVREIATGNLIHKVEQVYQARWGSNNRLLVQDNDNYGDRANGIWEIDLSTSPPTETRLVEGTGMPFDPSLRVERYPTWSPDGTQFVTLRDVAGFHYNADGGYAFHSALMLFTPGNPVGRHLLLLDHGTDAPVNLSWSPDGNYILYDLSEGERVDIWWVEVATGATGKLTDDGASIAADWRPRCGAAVCGGALRLFLPLGRR